jgi:pyruvate/2-oxoacid:ferredoxin oxidoreductase beta subunit/Pyruvate/2-oxoacid:ferredoxin oxidoreductase gamma subunit
MTSLLNTTALPFCKGCGHDLIAKNIAKAIERRNIDILDVISVTDIGCHGIIDKALNSHTVHGLHGRSVALGAGISFGITDKQKKIIVFVGDGGATIGLQHIMEAARLNLNMTVIIHNNFLYGMTGGQTSGLTPTGFATTTSYDGNPFGGYDLCSMSHAAGAAYVTRIIGMGDISETLEKAFRVDGFSLVEILEICPSYGVKLNPKRKFAEIVESSGKPLGEWVIERPAFVAHQGRKIANLLSKLPKIEQGKTSDLQKPLSIVLSGSAGEGIQLAAGLITKAAIKSNLEVTQKGSYPVTVGVGFSTAELNLSPNEINFHGIDIPDVAIITSVDGLGHSKKRIEAMKEGTLFIDSSLPVPSTGANVVQHDFRSIGARDASIFAVFYFAAKTGIITVDALLATIEEEGKSDKLPIEKIKKALAEI